MESITSLQNARVKQIRKLRDKRGREREGRFVIDEGRDLGRALDHGYTVDYALFCSELATGDDSDLVTRLGGAQIFSVPRAIMEKVSYRQNPSALVTVLWDKPSLGLAELDAIDPAQHPLILVLADLRKPGNIGALLRTADATGFTRVFLVDAALDLMNPNIIRSSTGACFLHNVYTLDSDEAVTFLRRRGYAIAAAVVDGDRDVFQADFQHPTAVVLGTEDEGLSAFWQECADLRLRIPMVGQVTDSLNVSVSGAVFMMEALRQRLSH